VGLPARIAVAPVAAAGLVDLTPAAAEGAACCAPVEQATCCAPEAKGDCCGAAAGEPAGETCGCR
jgi:hypothetical protein